MLHNTRSDRRMHHPRPPLFYCLFIDFHATLKVFEPAGTLSLEGWCSHCASVSLVLCKCQVMRAECANHGSHPWNISEKIFIFNSLTFWAQRGVHYRENRTSQFRQKPENHFENYLKAGNVSEKLTIWLWVEARYGCEEPCEKRNEESGERKYAEITVDLFFLPALTHSLSRSNDNLFHRAFFESLPVSFHCCACWWWSSS